jgi:hypothetical protein
MTRYRTRSDIHELEIDAFEGFDREQRIAVAMAPDQGAARSVAEAIEREKLRALRRSRIDVPADVPADDGMPTRAASALKRRAMSVCSSSSVRRATWSAETPRSDNFAFFIYRQLPSSFLHRAPKCVVESSRFGKRRWAYRHRHAPARRPGTSISRLRALCCPRKQREMPRRLLDASDLGQPTSVWIFGAI